MRCAGLGPARAYAAARGLIGEGAGAILSVGLAAGLDPGLAGGALVLGNEVVAPDGGRYGCEPRLRAGLLERLHAAGLEVAVGAVAGVDRPLLRPEEKARLFAAAGAKAADMESHGVARAAAEVGVPFLVLRAVADPADLALPRLADEALRPDGSLRPVRALMGLGSRPWELGRLLALACASRRAFAALRGVAPLLRRDLLEGLLDV